MIDRSCEERVDAHLANRMSKLRQLWKEYPSEIPTDEELGILKHYHFAMDYVVPGTFTDIEEGYFRYYLSGGGPSDEFRFFFDSGVYKDVEYWFLDWGDGAHRLILGKDKQLLGKIFRELFVITGIAHREYLNAQED